MIVSYIQTFQKYAVFSGRSSRSEYWGCQFVDIFVFISLILIVAIITSIADLFVDFSDDFYAGSIIWILITYFLARVIPMCAVAVRRLHDSGRSAWWLLLWPIPYVNLILLVFMLWPSESRPNKYGARPSPNYIE